MLWLFDTRREFLIQEYIPEFEAMNHEDFLEFQLCEEDDNVYTWLITNEKTLTENSLQPHVIFK